MKTVNSLSGGKTSSYLAMHYSANYDVFALVQIDDPACSPKDKGLIQAVSDKIGRQFIATAEHEKTLRVVLDLEQLIGREITWLAGESFDSLIARKNALPNKLMRFCTYEMKIEVIAKWWLMNIGKKVSMRIGYRFDEAERQEGFTTQIKIPVSCNLYGQNRQNLRLFDWRIGDFPLIRDRVTHPTIIRYWRDKGLIFPEDSNCQICFHKDPPQLRRNWDSAPEIMEWGAAWERASGHQFHSELSLDEIKQLSKQLEFSFSNGAGCTSYCHD